MVKIQRYTAIRSRSQETKNRIEILLKQCDRVFAVLSRFSCCMGICTNAI